MLLQIKTRAVDLTNKDGHYKYRFEGTSWRKIWWNKRSK